MKENLANQIVYHYNALNISMNDKVYDTLLIYYYSSICPTLHNAEGDLCDLDPDTNGEWQTQMLDFAKTHELLNKGFFSMTNLIFCLVFCIFNVLMTSMGQLAVELTHSLVLIFP